MSMTDQPDSGSSTDIVARGATYFRMTRVGMLILLAGIGAWFLYDGFLNWPREFDLYTARHLKPPHGWWDIFLNKLLGILLPPAGVFALVWGWHQSRGEIRLSGRTLHVPGHPPIPLEKIDSIDKSRWDKKGIAIVEYVLDDGGKRTFRLDDYVYDRAPIDEIYQIIEQTLGEPTAFPVIFPRAAKTPPARPPRVPTGKLPDSPMGPVAPRKSPPARTPPTSRMPPPPATRLPPRPKRDA
jgi:hypothetical protein